MATGSPTSEVSDSKSNSGDLERLLAIVSKMGTDINEDDGFTIEEFSKRIGKSKPWCREVIAKLIDAGEVVFVGRGKRPRHDGVLCEKPLYKKL